MKISLMPRLQEIGDAQLLGALKLERRGDVLIVNDQALDFSVVPAGATLPDGRDATNCEYFFGPIERDDAGGLSLTLLLPCNFVDAPEEARFPQPIIDPPDGPITLPQTNWLPLAPAALEVQGGDDASN